MEKWMGWSEGQVELFDIFGRVCAEIGREGADGVLGTIANPNRSRVGAKAFVSELAKLREKAAKVEGLEKENAGLKEELDKATRKSTLKAGSSDSSKTVSFENLEDRIASTPSRTCGGSTFLESPLDCPGQTSDAYKALLMKHNKLVTNHKELIAARGLLEDQLRAKIKLAEGWVKYANSLERKLEKLPWVPFLEPSPGSKVLVSTPLKPPQLVATNPLHDLALGPSTAGRDGSMPQTVKAKSMTPSKIAEPVSLRLLRCAGYHSKDPHFQHVDGRESELVRVPPKDSHSRISMPDSSPSKTLPESVVKERKSLPRGQNHPLSSSLHHSGLAKEQTTLVSVIGHDQWHTPLELTEVDSSSDIPVVVSSRSVRKRKRQADSRSEESTKVKLEVLSSSPVGLAGFNPLQAHESLDLDDIGEKYPTPKKSRQSLRVSTSPIRPMAKLSALRPASSNQQILPTPSTKERQLKRRQFEDGLSGIQTRDGDNLVKIAAGIASYNSKTKLQADPKKSGQRLGGLLESLSPTRQVLTPMLLSASTIETPQRTGDGPRESVLPSSASTARWKFSKMKQTAPDESEIGTISSRKTRSPITWPKHPEELFRAKPVCDLGLEHFKINPDYHQGLDYAFADVVRGREQRRCLPGCTKPACCGEKLRKFVELTRKSEGQQTRSQEEKNVRLLEEYLGDNKHRLRTMTNPEKEELLIQARTRELANKSGKHRHAYERRPSPPGFWRADFPTTQEMETDRAEAARLERELVAERYEEAMRPGGRWVFRDETNW